MRRIQHGTISGYTSVYWSCRCEACTEAWKLYMRRYRARRRCGVSDPQAAQQAIDRYRQIIEANP